MVNKTGTPFLIIIALVINITYQATTFFCSSQCAASGCNGWTAADCNNKCSTGYGWTSQPDSSCALSSTSNRALIDVSDDVGGGITVSPVSATPDCTTFTGITLQTYGSYTANTVVNFTAAGGTSLPHWGLDLFYGLILIDTNGPNPWSTSSHIFTNLDGATPTQNQPLTLNNANLDTSQQTYCGANNKWDNYYHMNFSYIHN